jgi:hypothetical protein
VPSASNEDGGIFLIDEGASDCHMFGYSWSKNYWTDRQKSWFILNLMFSAVRNLKFQYDSLSNLKDVSQRPVSQCGLSKMAWLFYFWIFWHLKMGMKI